MTDKRELLELAARAAGYRIIKWTSDGDRLILEGVDAPWSSIADDGDCARLEEAAGVRFVWHTDYVLSVPMWGAAVVEKYSAHNNDRQAARRLASTRAAAEVARNMK